MRSVVNHSLTAVSGYANPKSAADVICQWIANGAGSAVAVVLPAHPVDASIAQEIVQHGLTQNPQEQIAGDLLFPGSPEVNLGLGFLAVGPWDWIGHAEVFESKIDGKIARHLDRDEMVSNTLSRFCWLTIHCCQCQDHKNDPLTQKHYHNLQSGFAAIDRAARSRSGSKGSGSKDRATATGIGS